jgi:DNA-binding LacI/PurR family transcriptional regulator
MTLKRHAAARETTGDVHRVYEDLRGYILHAAADTSIASARQLAKRYDVGIAAARRALNRLVDEELLYSSPRRGYFVKRREVDTTAVETILYVAARQENMIPYLERKLEAVVDEAARVGKTLSIRPANYENVLHEASNPTVTGLIVPWMHAVYFEALAANPRLRVVAQFRLNRTDSHPRLAQVELDFQTTAVTGVNHLHSAGCRSIVCIWTNPLSELGARLTAQKSDMTLEDLEIVKNADGSVDPSVFVAAATALIAHEADGLVFDDDLYAVAILRELAKLAPDYRRRVVVVSLSNRHQPMLPDDVTCLEVDGYDVGVACVAVLEAAMCPPRMNCPTVLLPATLLPAAKPRTVRR